MTAHPTALVETDVLDDLRQAIAEGAGELAERCVSEIERLRAGHAAMVAALEAHIGWLRAKHNIRGIMLADGRDADAKTHEIVNTIVNGILSARADELDAALAKGRASEPSPS